MTKIKYVIGDATQPEGDGNRIITHVCNDGGGWGAGFVLALSAWDPMPEIAYRRWHAAEVDGPYVPSFPFALGKVQLVPFNILAQSGVYVANMIAQRTNGSFPPLSYLALATCLNKVRIMANDMRPQATVHMPRIGCGLAGGTWPMVEQLVTHFLCGYDVPVTVYDLPQ